MDVDVGEVDYWRFWAAAVQVNVHLMTMLMLQKS